MNKAKLSVLALTILLGFLVLNPILWLAFGSFWSSSPGSPGAFTLSNYVNAFASADSYSVFYNSVVFAAISTVIAFSIGVPLVWIVAGTNTPFRRFFEILSLIPYLIPGLVFAIGWVLLLSPTIGYINLLLMAITGVRSAPLNIYSIYGMSWLGGLWSVPVVFLIVSGALKNWDSSFDEVASTCGASWFRRFTTVTLPTIRPSLIVAAILVFVRMLEDFVFPAIVGLPARIHTFPIQIYGYFQNFQYGLATASSVFLFAVVALLLMFYSKAVQNQSRFAVHGGRGFASRERDIGRWRYLTFLFVLSYIALGVLLPLAVVVLASVLPIYSLTEISFSNFTSKFFVQLLNDTITMNSLVNSTFLAVAAASLAVAVSVAVAYLNARSRTAMVRLLGSFSVLPMAFPGVVLAMGLFWGYIFVKVGIYGTIWILLIAYLTRFLPYAERSVTSSFAQLNFDMDDAASVSGGGIFSRMRRVLLPLVKPGIATAWIIVCANSIQELSASVILYSSNSQVVGVSILQLYDYNNFNELSALSVILTAILGVLAFSVLRFSRTNDVTGN